MVWSTAAQIASVVPLCGSFISFHDRAGVHQVMALLPAVRATSPSGRIMCLSRPSPSPSSYQPQATNVSLRRYLLSSSLVFFLVSSRSHLWVRRVAGHWRIRGIWNRAGLLGDECIARWRGPCFVGTAIFLSSKTLTEGQGSGLHFSGIRGSKSSREICSRVMAGSCAGKSAGSID